MSPLVGLGRMKVCRADLDMRHGRRVPELRARQRSCYQLGHGGKIDRVEVEQIGLEVRVDQLKLDRLRAGQAFDRQHSQYIEYAVLPAVNVSAIARILRFDRDAIGVNLDPQHARMLAGRGAQRRHCRTECSAVIEETRLRAAAGGEQRHGDQRGKRSHPRKAKPVTHHLPVWRLFPRQRA